MKLEDHQLLAETSAGTAMGNLLRRYWFPAILSRELEAGGAPVRVRLLGEDLIAFRNTAGKVGLFGERCAHRGASLFFGRNADCKLRCWYHGWQYELDGTCTDQPNEPPQTQFKQHVRQKAYPSIERNGVVWTYMGPSETRPTLPDLEFLTVPDSHVYVSKRLQRCHWTQGMEGDLDSAHLSILHSDLLKQRAANPHNRSAIWAMRELQPEIKTEAMPNGLLLAAKRAAEADTYYWRVNQWFMPCFTNWPIPGDNPQAGHAWVPIDDTQCWVFTFSWHPARPLREDELALMRGGSDIHEPVDPKTFEPLHNKSNDYAGPNTNKPCQPWMGVTALQAQDLAMTESMGPLYDRTQENLSASDLVVAQARRRLIVAARDLAKGVEPPGREAAAYRLRPLAMELPRDVSDWREAVAERMDARPETFRVSV
ncbi:MAG TPA: Rieske 2Fe-2S domain-containing protein [Stellaceae bacterium]|jgi:phenylpropionate dioxygenase-like ring-hydroxylating dioxygenase large terminal subunit|nr:Rieske 2Fe-2S domain-containing protein [Stellaceae bacterium]